MTHALLRGSVDFRESVAHPLELGERIVAEAAGAARSTQDTAPALAAEDVLPLAIHVGRRAHIASAPAVRLPLLAPLPLHPRELLEELRVVGGVASRARKIPSFAPPLVAHPGLAAEGEDL